MRKMDNKDPERCRFCHLDLGRQDVYENMCGCGMKKCYFDCKTEMEKDKWNDEEGA